MENKIEKELDYIKSDFSWEELKVPEQIIENLY